ncbi:MAG: DUF2130 domain-containing protein [Bacteroidia bacterium]|nr:DUF2130 domain-containing protein [Bacteroidia bacterium]
MSNSSNIICPNCKHEFPIGNALTQQIETDIRNKYLKVYNDDKQKLEAERAQINKLLEQAKIDAENQEKIISEKVKLQKAVLEQEAIKKAASEMALQMEMLNKELSEKETKLKDSQAKELQFLLKAKELQEKEAQFELTLQQKLQAERELLSEQIKKQELEKNSIKEKDYQLQMMELKKQLEDQKKLTEEMVRKQGQGSMQMQGEVQELILEELLRSTFPFDSIDEVGKGVKGADAIHTVRNPLGQVCGRIIYESKNTKAFGGDWIDKLKHDMRSSQADIAVIVTETMPKDMDRFGMKDGVWICNFTEIKSLAFVLRDSLIKIYAAQASQENKGDKMSMLYSYLTGTEFRQQIEAIVEGFTELQMGIQREKNAMQKIWKEREKQLEKVLLNTTNFYGSVKGIAGNAIGDIKLLELGEDEV